MAAYISRGPEYLANVIERRGISLFPGDLDFDRLEIIVGNYGDPNILDNRKAVEMISAYPRPAEPEHNLVNALHHLEPGAAVYVVTENRNKWRNIHQAFTLAGVIFDPIYTRGPVTGGVQGSSIITGHNGIGIPIWSIHGGATSVVYDMYGWKVGG